MKLAVIGLGLIGGSIALEAKASGFAQSVIGVESSLEHAEQAKLLGITDRISTLAEACAQADFIILAMPVGQIIALLPKVLDLISERTVVTDVGSTKESLADRVRGHTRRDQYVPSHPMAGTEFSGPRAAHLGLFKGKAAVICDRSASTSWAVKTVEALYASLQMRIIYMESKAHDLHAAYVSHLSHISSFVLANTVLDKEKDVEAIFNLASGGFESTVRLAKSSPAMWSPIFEQNQVFIAEALGAYIERLKVFQQNLQKNDFTALQTSMLQANQIGRVLTEIGNRGIKS